MTNEIKKVHWRDGILLKPQHFQGMESYFERILHIRSLIQHRYYWGFDQLILDHSQLEKGLVFVHSLQAILPNGSCICYYRKGEQRDNLLFVEFEKQNAPILFYICYSDEKKIAIDTGVEYYSPRLLLLNEKEAQPFQHKMPIFRITLNQQHKAIIDPSFIPALLNTNASTQLNKKISEWSERLNTFLQNLTAELPGYHQAHALHCTVSLIEAEEFHPFKMYLMLYQAIYSHPFPSSDRLEREYYNHDNLLQLIDHFDLIIKELTTKKAKDDKSQIKLSRKSEHFWLAELNSLPAREAQSARITLKSNYRLSSKQLQQIKIVVAERSLIGDLVDHALNGLKFTMEVTEHPAGISLLCDCSHHFWEDIIEKNNLMLFVSDQDAIKSIYLELLNE